MVIHRRQRSPSPSHPDSDWLKAKHASRPWDNDIARLKPPAPVIQVSVLDRKRQFDNIPPPSRESNPLNAFLPPRPAPSSPSSLASPNSLSPEPPTIDPPSPPPLKNRLGNRNVKPLLDCPNIPPLVGLPIPPSQSRPRSTSSKPVPESTSRAAKIASQVPLPPPPPLASMTHLDQSYTSRRYSTRQSTRHSVRVPSVSPVALPNPSSPPAVQSKPMSTLPHPTQLDLLPDSSSFLDFNDDHRLNPIENIQPTESSVPENVSYDDDPDSFDTFASLPNQIDLNTDPPQDAPTPPLNPLEKPAFPSLSLNANIENKPLPSPRTSPNDDEDGGLDIPARISATPAANRAMRDLQRASITAANELANSIRLMSQQKQNSGQFSPVLSERIQSTPSQGPTGPRNSTQRLQGQLLLRSRLFRRWNLRYATVVNQAYFGPVLLLFRPESKPMFQSSFSLKSSKMIALAHSTVAVQDEPRKHNNGLVYTFCLTTSQRNYTFACNDLKTRSTWIASLSTSPSS